jgi:hypothetical protein
MGPQCQDRSYPRESCRPRLLGGGLRLPGGRDREPTIGDNHTSRRVAVLRPLRYHNAGPLIAAWFSERPAWAGPAAQLRDRPDLSRARHRSSDFGVYRVAGGDQPLPHCRADLYATLCFICTP